ncbi:MAG: extracellular solute-binding protein, partial [Huintestinicola sp.]
MNNKTRIMSGILALTMAASFAGCGSKAESDSSADNAANTTAEASADNGGNETEAPATEAPAPSDGDVNIKISWWGGDSRHEATQNAINAFMEKNPNIKVDVQFGAWSGWEDAMSTSFYAGTAPD